MLVSERARSEVAASVSTAIARVDGVGGGGEAKLVFAGFWQGWSGKTSLEKKKERSFAFSHFCSHEPAYLNR